MSDYTEERFKDYKKRMEEFPEIYTTGTRKRASSTSRDMVQIIALGDM